MSIGVSFLSFPLLYLHSINRHPPCQAPAVCPSPHFLAPYGTVGYPRVGRRGRPDAYGDVGYDGVTYGAVSYRPVPYAYVDVTYTLVTYYGVTYATVTYPGVTYYYVVVTYGYVGKGYH